MSTVDPTIRDLTPCGCCSGTGQEAPERITNRPGLSAVAYRVGTHSRFRATLLARLSGADLPALARLTARDDRDFAIALLDGWATIGDVLTFYQERIANEGYLRTATERRSVASLADLVGYLPSPGLAASAYLAFSLEETGVPTDTPVPLGTRVQSIPGPGQLPQVYETIEAVVGRSEWNAIRPRLRRPHPPITTTTDRVTVRGVATDVARGDNVLLVAGAQPDERVLVRVIRVAPDPVAGTTTFDLAETPVAPGRFVLNLPLHLFDATPVTLSDRSVGERVLTQSWHQDDFVAFAAVQRWPVGQLRLNIAAQVARLAAPAPRTGVFALRTRPSVFGYNAPKWDSLPASQRFADYVTGSTGSLVVKSAPYPNTWEGRKLSAEPGAARNAVDLDATYPAILPGDDAWLVLDGPGARHVYGVQSTSDVTRTDFTLTAKVTRVALDDDAQFGVLSLRDTTVLAQSERLELAELPITDDVEGNRVLLDGPYLGLRAGRPVILTGERADLRGVTTSEVAIIASADLQGGFTELVFTEALGGRFVRPTVTINANVALATHGESKDTALGDGDATTPYQRFVLPEAPLTHTTASNPRGVASSLEVRVNDVRWDEVESFVARGPRDRVYLVRSDESGRASVRFGDGRAGARLPTGRENVRARYRKGIGEAGLVEAGQLSLLQTKPTGLRTVSNSTAASGAADPEGIEDVRRNAGLAIRSLGRIVSLRDYEDFARAFRGVAKALATWTWDGRRRGVYVTVAGPAGRAIEEHDPVRDKLLLAMSLASDPWVPIRVKTYRPAWFRLRGRVTVDPARTVERISDDISATLRARFGFALRELGRPVWKSEVIAAIQDVDGVVAVDLDELYRVDATPDELAAGRLFDRLVAAAPSAGTATTLAAELLVLDPRPPELEVTS